MFDPSIYSLARDKQTGIATVTFDPTKGTTQGADRIGRHAFHVPAYITGKTVNVTRKITSRNPLRFRESQMVTRTYAARDWSN